MIIREVKGRPPLLIARLVEVWEASVRATHLFLSDQEIRAIRGYVPQALEHVAHLMVAEREDGAPAAFLGAEEQRLEMLFLAPDARGQGLGKRLLHEGIARFSIRELAVNEQNPQARGFYEHMGFRVVRRAELDEQGNPYPLLYMRLEGLGGADAL